METSRGVAPDPRLALPSGTSMRPLIARRRGFPVARRELARNYRLDRLHFVLWPERRPGPPGTDPNERATVLLAILRESRRPLDCGCRESDSPFPQSAACRDLQGRAPHLPTWGVGWRCYPKIRPRVAVVSVGAGQRTATRRRGCSAIRSPGLRLFRTDEDGASSWSPTASGSESGRTAAMCSPGVSRDRTEAGLPPLRAAIARRSSGYSSGSATASPKVPSSSLAAEQTSGDDAAAACNALGLFGEEGRLVVVDGVDVWKAADVKAIATYL